MMKKRIGNINGLLFVLALSGLCALIFCACLSPLTGEGIPKGKNTGAVNNGDETGAAATGEAYLEIRLPGGTGNARAVVTPAELGGMRYEITLSGPNGEKIDRTLSGGETTLTERVAPGTWTITIRAYVDTLDPGVSSVVSSGQLRGIVTTTVTAQSGLTAPVPITLGTVTGVKTWAELSAAIIYADDNDAIILEEDVEFDRNAIPIPSNTTVTLLAEGDRVISAGAGSHASGFFELLSANANATLILGDSLMPGTLTLRGNAALLNGALIKIETSTTLIMNDKVTLTGNTHPVLSGGAVVVDGGEFIMNGGTITGNASSYSGGGVSVNSGTFEMHGGTITGNATLLYGGGVFIDTGIFEMKGGNIAGNSAIIGHGVCVDSGNFSWTGGSISIADIKRHDGIDTWDLKGWASGSEFSPGGPMPTAWNGDGVPVWTGDGSTAALAIAVTSQAELAAIGNSAATLGLCYYLAADITISGTWTPLGNATTSFTGSLNGNGHTITFNNAAVTLVSTSLSGDGAGLFGRISGSGAAVSNLKLTGDLTCTLPTSLLRDVEISVIGGYVRDGAKISSCGSEVNLTVVHSGAYPSRTVIVGGIVGSLENSEISNCYNRGDVTNTNVGTGTSVYAGGIAGQAYNSGTTTIEYCYTTGSVDAGSNGTAGGVVGYSDGAVDLSYLVALNSGLIANSATVGRVIGVDSTSTANITDCYGLTGMPVNGGIHVWSSSITGQDGLNVTSTQAALDTWWTGTALWPIGSPTDPWWWDNFTLGDEHPELW
jgi:hypothetical protein